MRALAEVRPTTEFDGKYLGLTTFKQDGRGVTTPVWFVPRDGQLLVETDADSYKVKRIRHQPVVTVGLCTVRGGLRQLPVPAHAELLPDEEIPQVEALMARKYRVEVLFFRPLRAIQRALHLGRYRGKPVIVAITPS